MRKPESAPPSLKALAADRPGDVAIVPLDITNPAMFDSEGRSIFGAIDQTHVQAKLR